MLVIKIEKSDGWWPHRREIRPPNLPQGGGIRLRIRSNPLLCPLLAHMGVGGAKL